MTIFVILIGLGDWKVNDSQNFAKQFGVFEKKMGIIDCVFTKDEDNYKYFIYQIIDGVS